MSLQSSGLACPSGFAPAVLGGQPGGAPGRTPPRTGVLFQNTPEWTARWPFGVFSQGASGQRSSAQVKELAERPPGQSVRQLTRKTQEQSGGEFGGLLYGLSLQRLDGESARECY
jgi:hypothetical protein